MAPIINELEARPFLSRRSVGVGVAAAVAVAGLVGGPMAWQEHQASLCERQGQRLEGVWDDGVRGRVDAAFAATGHERWQTLARQSAKSLDTYANAWVAESRASCLTTVAGDQPERVGELRASCYASRFLDLQAVAAALLVTDADAAEHAPVMVRSLPGLEGCAELAQLELQGSIDRGGAAQELLDQLDADIARASAMSWAERDAEALALADRAWDRAEKLSDTAAKARIARLRGSSRLGLRDYEGALSELDAAVALAELAGDTRGLVHAMIGLEAAYFRQNRFAEAKVVVDLVENKLATLPESTRRDLELEHAYNVAAAAYHQNDLERAERELGEVIALAGDVDPSSRWIALHASNARGAVMAGLGRIDAAQTELARALSIAEQYYGPDHPQLAHPVDNLAVVMHWRGDYEAAIEMHTRAIELLSAAANVDPEVETLFHTNLAESLCAAHERKGAIESLRDWVARVERRDGPDSPYVIRPLRALAGCQREDGDARAALEPAERALSMLEGIEEPKAADLVDAHTVLADIYVDLGDAGRARQHFEEARRLDERSPMEHEKKGNLALARGRLLRLEGKPDEAARAFLVAEEAFGEADPTRLASVRFEHARALYPIDRAQAVALVEANARLPRSDRAGRALTEQMQTWLASHPLSAG